MRKANDRTSKRCLNPWYNFLAIFCVAAFTMTAIFVLDKYHVKISFNKLNFIKGFFKEDKSRDNILVAATGTDLKSSVAVQFETCRYFVVVRESSEKYEYFSNTQAHYNENAVREFVRRQNIEAVITGTMEIGTFQMLNSTRVDVFTGVTGTVEDALRKYRKDKLVSYSRHYHNRRRNKAANDIANP